MKKVALLLCSILLFVFASCTTYKMMIPIGLWQSDDLSITLDITSEVREHYGTYIKDGKEVEIVVVFSHLNNQFYIYDKIIDDENQEGSMTDYEYFCGTFNVEDDKIYYTLLPKWEGMHGVKEIIFTKVVD